MKIKTIHFKLKNMTIVPMFFLKKVAYLLVHYLNLIYVEIIDKTTSKQILQI